MKQFVTVEDYIEVLAGIRDIETGMVNLGWIFSYEPIINLARYDVNFVNTLAETVVNKTPMTDRQAELACKILLKYHRQLLRKGVDVTPVEKPVYRLPLREIDRSKLLCIKDDYLHMKFAYNTELISTLKEAAKESSGTLKWNHDLKVWQVGLTETNLTIAVEVARKYQFEISQEVLVLYASVQKVENEPYAIELQLTDTGCTVDNGAWSLMEYINKELGGFTHDNLYRLVDASGVLGYTVSEEIKQALSQDSNLLDYLLSAQHKIKQKPNLEKIIEILEYAQLTNRWPVYVYDPTLNNWFKHLVIASVGDEQVLDTTLEKHTASILPTDGKKVVFMNKYNTAWENSIPLLISTQGMMFGGEKTILLQRAEKVVFFAEDVYTKNKRK